MKILVTGGAGYIGSHTCVELSNAGFIPVILDNFSNSEHYIVDRIKALCNGPVIAYDGDCTDEDYVAELFQKEQDIAGVIHFAAFKAVGESYAEPLKYYHNNIESTRILLEAVYRAGVKNFVFSSSCTVYGQPDKLPVTEMSPVKKAESPYGRTKQICEDMLEDFLTAGNPVQVISLRYFNPIGAHPSAQIGELPIGVPNNLVPFITQSAIGKRPALTIFGNDYDTPDGTCIRDYIHVVDLARAHVRSLEFLTKRNFNPEFMIFNLGTGQGTSVQEVVDTFEKVTGIKLTYNYGARRPGDVVQVYADVSKASEVLGWNSELTLKDALRDAWAWEQKIDAK